MPSFRKIPVIIEAIRFTGDNVSDIAEFAGYDLDFGAGVYHDALVIETLEGDLNASVGDWVIKGIKGELYPCKPDIFAMTYEAVADDGEVTT
jgi:hypothetical protein